MKNLERLRELAAKATEGPWETDSYMPTKIEECCIQIIAGGAVLFESSNCSTVCIDCEVDEGGVYYHDIGSTPNFDFIAAARNALPAIIALATTVAQAVEAGAVDEIYLSLLRDQLAAIEGVKL